MPFPILAPFNISGIDSVFTSQFVFHKIIYSILKVLSYIPYFFKCFFNYFPFGLIAIYT